MKNHHLISALGWNREQCPWKRKCRKTKMMLVRRNKGSILSTNVVDRRDLDFIQQLRIQIITLLEKVAIILQIVGHGDNKLRQGKNCLLRFAGYCLRVYLRMVHLSDKPSKWRLDIWLLMVILHFLFYNY